MKLKIDDWSQKIFKEMIIFKDVLNNGLKGNSNFNLNIWCDELTVFKR